MPRGGRRGQLGLALAELDVHVFHVGEEGERAERDGSDRVDPSTTAQDGITDRLAGRHERVVEFAGADLGDPGAVAGVLEDAVLLAEDGERERTQAIGRRGRPAGGCDRRAPGHPSRWAGRGVSGRGRPGLRAGRRRYPGPVDRGFAPMAGNSARAYGPWPPCLGLAEIGGQLGPRRPGARAIAG